MRYGLSIAFFLLGIEFKKGGEWQPLPKKYFLKANFAFKKYCRTNKVRGDEYPDTFFMYQNQWDGPAEYRVVNFLEKITHREVRIIDIA